MLSEMPIRGLDAEDADSGRVPTNLRMLLILETLALADKPLTPTEINKSIGLPKQSIHRLCQTLMDEGFLVRDMEGKRLKPAQRLMTIARGLFSSRHLNVARRQVLLAISEATGETVNFAVPEAEGMTYLDRVETDWIFRIELPIGSRVPFYCTASGKCYLASLSNAELERVFKTLRLTARTENTLTTREALVTELNQVREQGYAIDNEELFSGMIALAVPVTDRNGRYFASVAFHGPTQRLNHEKLLEHISTMRESAKKLSSVSV
ncbi:MAG: IclR family transcriptional regulator [Pseudomonadota bacterium]